MTGWVLYVRACVCPCGYTLFFHSANPFGPWIHGSRWVMSRHGIERNTAEIKELESFREKTNDPAATYC